ncbi:hypothetical protein GCM10010277_80500 [Streptomyces longisporoflavus]|nr:hypothetical protein GCM10010277_80500 [Streptomyces longisporoflavus]
MSGGEPVLRPSARHALWHGATPQAQAVLATRDPGHPAPARGLHDAGDAVRRARHLPVHTDAAPAGRGGRTEDDGQRLGHTAGLTRQRWTHAKSPRQGGPPRAGVP